MDYKLAVKINERRLLLVRLLSNHKLSAVGVLPSRSL